jgi:hypothetical protein
MNFIKQNPLIYDTIKVAFICGTIYGIGQGIHHFLMDYYKLPAIKLNKYYLKQFEGIVNVSLKCGVLTLYILFYGLSCGVVASTAPISVPLIIYFGK